MGEQRLVLILGDDPLDQGDPSWLISLTSPEVWLRRCLSIREERLLFTLVWRAVARGPASHPRCHTGSQSTLQLTRLYWHSLTFSFLCSSGVSHQSLHVCFAAFRCHFKIGLECAGFVLALSHSSFVCPCRIALKKAFLRCNCQQN